MRDRARGLQDLGHRATKSGAISWCAETFTAMPKACGSPSPPMSPSLHRRRSGQARSSTHRPMSLIAPDCSASGINVVGGIRPNDGWSQRRSASAPRIRPHSLRNSPRSTARPRSRWSATNLSAKPCSCTSTTWWVPPPRRFAWYMTMSASRSSSSGSVPFGVENAMPTLADTSTTTSSRGNGDPSASTILRAIMWICTFLVIASQTMTNCPRAVSGPPCDRPRRPGARRRSGARGCR